MTASVVNSPPASLVIDSGTRWHLVTHKKYLTNRMANTFGDGTANILGNGIENVLGSGIANILGDEIANVFGNGIANILGNGIANVLGIGLANLLGNGTAHILGNGIVNTLGTGIAYILGNGIENVLGNGIASILGNGIANTLGTSSVEEALQSECLGPKVPPQPLLHSSPAYIIPRAKLNVQNPSYKTQRRKPWHSLRTMQRDRVVWT